MNIFKPFYRETKSYLFRYGDWLSEKQFSIESDVTFETISDVVTRKWFRLINSYLRKLCDDEERKFIRLLYFNKNKINFVAMHFPMCVRACQEWREEIMKNLILLATQERIIKINLIKLEEQYENPIELTG